MCLGPVFSQCVCSSESRRLIGIQKAGGGEMEKYYREMDRQEMTSQNEGASPRAVFLYVSLAFIYRHSLTQRLLSDYDVYHEICMRMRPITELLGLFLRAANARSYSSLWKPLHQVFLKGGCKSLHVSELQLFCLSLEPPVIITP